MSSRRKVRIAVGASAVLVIGLLGGGGYAAWCEHERMRPRFISIVGERVTSIEANGSGSFMLVESVLLHRELTTSLTVVDVAPGGTCRDIGVAGYVTDVAISDDGELVALGTRHDQEFLNSKPAEKVQVLSLRRAERDAEFDVKSLDGLAFTSDGRRLVEGRQPAGRIEYRDLATGTITTSIPASEGFRSLQRAGPDLLLEFCSPDRASPGRACTIVQRRLATGELVGSPLGSDQYHAATTPRTAIIAVPDGGLKGVTVRSLPNGNVLRNIAVPNGNEWAVALSSDGELLAIVSYDAANRHSVDIFSIASGARLRTWNMATEVATCVAFVPGSDTLAVGTGRGGIELHPFRR